jgi:hypothetical protein
MSAPAAPPAHAADDAPSALERARALIEPQLQFLTRLSQIGMDVAEAIGRQVRGEDPPAKGDPSLAFARASRAVRLTIALQSKLVEALAALEAGPPGSGHGGVPDDARGDPDYILKARVERIVERAAEAEHPDDARTVDRVVHEAGERLDDIDLYGDLLDRPMSEILARICRDLDLPLDWSRLAQEAWAQTELRGGAAGAPLAALLDSLDARPPPVADGDGADGDGADGDGADPGGAARRRTAARLAVTARRGRRAEAAKARAASPEPIDYVVAWADPAPASGRASAGQDA